MANPTLRFKRGSQSAFASVGLSTGEPSFITDESNFYIGINTLGGDNRFFGSSRYWRKESTTIGGGVNLFGTHAVGVSGTSITLAAPASVGTAVTYTFPAGNGPASSVLTNDGSGTLSWSSGSSNPVFTGIATFSTTLLDINSDVDISGITTVSNVTDNTLGNENTGSLQLDGGMGIAKNLTVKQNLHVGGYAEFVGVVTFKGGTINIGDANTDDINVGGEFISGLVPNTDDAHDLGNNGQRWRNLNVVSVATTNINVTGVSTFVGIATFTSSNVFINNQLFVGGLAVTGGASIGLDITTRNLLATGISTFTGLIDANGGLDVTGHTVLNNTLAVTGVSTFTGAIDANGGADISGGETVLSSATVSDLTASRIVIAGTSGSLVDDSSLTFTDAAGLIVANSGINVTGVSTFSTDLVVGGDLQVTGNDIKSSTGAVAITLAGNDVTVADDLTVSGNLYVNGSTTQVNTTALTVEDRTIDLGIVNGATPAGATTWDLGILFNYFATTAKKSAVIWEHGDSRFKFASVLSADTDGTTVDTPQLTVTTFAPIEVGELWVNSACTGGTQQIIGCVNSELQLQNIVVDGGTFW